MTYRPQGVYSKMYTSAQTFFMIPKKINTKQNRTQKNKSIKITDPKNIFVIQLSRVLLS